jgi:glycosyltransferase involved in cell wall biosynthesis
LAAPLARVPVVVASERNTDYTQRLLHKVALRLTQPLFDVMVANSQAGKEFNIRTLGLPESRIEVVHNGVDTTRFRPDREAGTAFRKQLGIPFGRPVVGMIASFKRQKGHDRFLEMAVRLRQSTANALFMIVGGPLQDGAEAGGEYEAEIKRMAESLGLADCCIFVGNQKDMTTVYNACDVTALLSHREGTPNVVLESMACGVPVVVSDVADNRIIVQDGVTGYLVHSGDIAGAAESVRRLFCSPQSRIEFGKTARDYVICHFSLSNVTARLEAIYRSYLDKKEPRRQHIAVARSVSSTVTRV